MHERVQLRLLFTTQRLVWLAGFVLIGVGIVCLYLSDAVAHGWWQGTLDAFGVGFIVGGLVDVLAISGMNQVLTGDQRRRQNNFEAEAILRSQEDREARGVAAGELLIRSGSQIDPRLRAQLNELAYPPVNVPADPGVQASFDRRNPAPPPRPRRPHEQTPPPPEQQAGGRS